MDDLVILSESKPFLHQILAEIREYLFINLKLEIKDNYQIFPIASRGIDFVGYVFYHTHTKLRKSIKKRFARKMDRGVSIQTIAAYKGWTDHANCKHLMKKLTDNGIQ